MHTLKKIKQIHPHHPRDVSVEFTTATTGASCLVGTWVVITNGIVTFSYEILAGFAEDFVTGASVMVVSSGVVGSGVVGLSDVVVVVVGGASVVTFDGDGASWPVIFKLLLSFLVIIW